VRTSASQRVAFVASLAYIFAPFALVYEGFSWLSEQPMLFFLLLSIYALKTRNWKVSAIAYGVAVMFKQDALFLLPAYVFWTMKQHGIGRGLKSIGLFAAVVLIISAPFLILTFNGYMETMTFGKLGNLFPFSPPLLPPSQGVPLSIIGGASISSLSVSQLGCAVATNNLFGISNICLVLWNGVTITNGITILPSTFVQEVLIAFALLLLVPLIAEVLLLRPERRLVFSFALCGALVLVPVLLLSELPNYKYYLVPFYALMLTSSTDAVTVVISSTFPIMALLNPFGYFNELIPVVEMQFMMVYWLLRKRGGE
jgi:hypothetical protein